MLRLFNKKGQSTLEYAVLIAVIVAGLLTMQMFMKRGYQGRLRSSTDDIGEQFSPEYATTNYTATSNMIASEKTTQATGTLSHLSQTQSRTGSETVEALSAETWPQ